MSAYRLSRDAKEDVKEVARKHISAGKAISRKLELFPGDEIAPLQVARYLNYAT